MDCENYAAIRLNSARELTAGLTIGRDSDGLSTASKRSSQLNCEQTATLRVLGTMVNATCECNAWKSACLPIVTSEANLE